MCWQPSTDANSFQTDSTIAAGSSGFTNCPDTISRVFIPDSNVGGDRREVTKDLYCGEGGLLPAYVCSITSNMITVDFNSPPNNLVGGGTGDTMKGFKLIYRKLPSIS